MGGVSSDYATRVGTLLAVVDAVVPGGPFTLDSLGRAPRTGAGTESTASSAPFASWVIRRCGAELRDRYRPFVSGG